jgi:hypothetical protein
MLTEGISIRLLLHGQIEFTGNDYGCFAASIFGLASTRVPWDARLRDSLFRFLT